MSIPKQMTTAEELTKIVQETIGDERPTTLDYEEVSTLEYLKRRAREEPNREFVIFPKGKTLSYSELLSAVKKFSVGLRKLGIEKGDRVSILLPNTPHYLIAHFAIQSLGAIVVQSNPIYTVRELVDQVNDSGAKAMVTLTLFQEKANKVMEQTNMKYIIAGRISDYLGWLTSFLGRLLGKLDDPAYEDRDRNREFKDLLMKNDESEYREEEINIHEDVAILQYTGGTTGKSKGAMLTFANVSFNSQQARGVIPTIEEKTGRILTALPLFHSFGLTVCLGNALQLNVPLVLVPRFNPADALKYIEEYKVSFFPGVPTMMIALLNHEDVEKRDLSSLIAVLSGGAPLPVEVAKRFSEVTGGDLVEGYGLSEASPVTHSNPVKAKSLKPKIGSIGLPVADTEMKVVDPEDYNSLMDIGEIGELCIKGPQVFKGYWADEENTNKALKDGWLRTGDIARVDEEGYTYIVDRKKDLIIVSGYNVVPREIEEVLYEHPKVLEAAVAGVSHDVKGEIVAAWVVLREGETATEEELIEYCKENLAPYKIPKQVGFRQELPKSMVGKILRRELVEEEEQAD